MRCYNHVIYIFLILIEGLVINCGASSTIQQASTLQVQMTQYSNNIIQSHIHDFYQFDPVKYLKTPRSVVWNTIINNIKSSVSISTSDYDNGIIETNWSYDDPQVTIGLARQLRKRYKIQVAYNDPSNYDASITTSWEERQRETCKSSTNWVPTTGQPDVLESNIKQSIESLRRLNYNEITFPGTLDSMLPIVSDIIIKRWGLSPMPDGIQFPIKSGWRETELFIGGINMEARSKVEVNAVPINSGIQFNTNAIFQYRGYDNSSSSLWHYADASIVVEDFITRLIGRVNPMVIEREDVEPLIIVDSEPEISDLPNPPDSLIGKYQLYLKAVQVPLKRNDGSDWDEGASIVGKILEQSPNIIKIVTGLSIIEPTTIIGSKLLELGSNIAAEIGRKVGKMSSPDIQVELSLPVYGNIATSVYKNSHVAGWREPIVNNLILNGQGGVINWVIYDRDFDNNFEKIVQGNVSIEELANGCGIICKQFSGYDDGGQICFELEKIYENFPASPTIN